MAYLRSKINTDSSMFEGKCVSLILEGKLKETYSYIIGQKGIRVDDNRAKEAVAAVSKGVGDLLLNEKKIKISLIRKMSYSSLIKDAKTYIERNFTLKISEAVWILMYAAYDITDKELNERLIHIKTVLSDDDVSDNFRYVLLKRQNNQIYEKESSEHFNVPVKGMSSELISDIITNKLCKKQRLKSESFMRYAEENGLIPELTDKALWMYLSIMKTDERDIKCEEVANELYKRGFVNPTVIHFLRDDKNRIIKYMVRANDHIKQ